MKLVASQAPGFSNPLWNYSNTSSSCSSLETVVCISWIVYYERIRRDAFNFNGFKRGLSPAIVLEVIHLGLVYTSDTLHLHGDEHFNLELIPLLPCFCQNCTKSYFLLSISYDIAYEQVIQVSTQLRHYNRQKLAAGSLHRDRGT